MNKPPYKVMSMTDVVAIPWNGYNVVSTFSGCGGSCLGYRMAGYRVLWANEFIPEAQKTYKANHPKSILETRDIRQVSPGDILSATGLGLGEIDIFDGSPPCAAFSAAGKREAGWGKVKQYSDTKQRVDDLFFEYVRLVKGTQPKVFVAENVSGLIKGTAKGYFIEILKALKACGYNVKCKVLDAQWLGVPQMRQRTIFIGVREDLVVEPVHPDPLPYRYSVGDAIKNMPALIESEAWNISPRFKILWENTTPGDSEGFSRANEKLFKKTSGMTRYRVSADKACNCIKQGTRDIYHYSECRNFSIAELRRICAFPDDFILTGSYAQQWERLGRAVPPVMMMHIAKTIQNGILDKIS